MLESSISAFPLNSMHWTEPATVDDSHADLEKKLWDAANQLWAGADRKDFDALLTILKIGSKEQQDEWLGIDLTRWIA